MTEKNAHAVALGKLGAAKGGRSKSLAKAEAARKNGKKGGRPPELCWCGYARVTHCEFNEPGADHTAECAKMHHEFRARRPYAKA